MKRRDFLKQSAMTTAALLGTPLSARTAAAPPRVRSYRPLGRTGLRMSDISLGCGKLSSPSMVVRAVDRGINYLDTAPDYGRSEQHIGQALKRLQRDKLILASKLCRPGRHGHLPAGSRKQEYIEAVEASLTRLGTDYLDICLVHAIGSLSKDFPAEKQRLLDEEMLAAVEAMKKAGKIRFLGVSSHGPHHLEELLLTAVRSGHYDLIMPAFNFMTGSDLPPLLQKARPAVGAASAKKRPSLKRLDILQEARKLEVGVVAMKTLAGARKLHFESDGRPFQPAAFKWVLAHPEISGLVVTIQSVEQLDLYLSASGQRLSDADRRLLNRYARRHGSRYCRTGCGQCESRCPHGVAIAASLRYQMYFADYGMEKRAMESYAGLTDNAGPCLACARQPCVAACPYGLEVGALLRAAHRSLSFRA